METRNGAFIIFFLIGITSFVCATLAYDLAQVGLARLVMNAVSGVLEFAGCVVLFIAFEALSYPDTYGRTDEEHPIGKYIVALFYALAIVMLLGTGLLLMWILFSRGLQLADQLVLMWGILVTGVCAFMGYRVQREKVEQEV